MAAALLPRGDLAALAHSLHVASTSVGLSRHSLTARALLAHADHTVVTSKPPVGTGWRGVGYP